jgi:hypothetical protein
MKNFHVAIPCHDRTTTGGKEVLVLTEPESWNIKSFQSFPQNKKENSVQLGTSDDSRVH